MFIVVLFLLFALMAVLLVAASAPCKNPVASQGLPLDYPLQEKGRVCGLALER